MIDRNARNQLATLIRRYLDEEITQEDFEEKLDEFIDSDDTAVRFVTKCLSYSYYDYEDHFVGLSKQGWDYLQRLLLLLDSNSTVTIRESNIWSFKQPVAAALLIACLIIVMQTGFGYHLLLYFIPLGLGSILLSLLRRPEIQNNPFHEIIAPFQSINDLCIAYESVNFVKRRYPSHFKSRQIHYPETDAIFGYVLWAMSPPVVLLLQCFPDSDYDIRVIPA